MQILSSLMVLEVVVMTIYNATGDDKPGIMTILGFQCSTQGKLMCDGVSWDFHIMFLDCQHGDYIANKTFSRLIEQTELLQVPFSF